MASFSAVGAPGPQIASIAWRRSAGVMLPNGVRAGTACAPTLARIPACHWAPTTAASNAEGSAAPASTIAMLIDQADKAQAASTRQTRLRWVAFISGSWRDRETDYLSKK